MSSTDEDRAEKIRVRIEERPDYMRCRDDEDILWLIYRLDKSQTALKRMDVAYRKRGHLIHQRESRRRLEKAERAGIGAVLLEVQQDCINERKRVKQLEDDRDQLSEIMGSLNRRG